MSDVVSRTKEGQVKLSNSPSQQGRAMPVALQLPMAGGINPSSHAVVVWSYNKIITIFI